VVLRLGLSCEIRSEPRGRHHNDRRQNGAQSADRGGTQRSCMEMEQEPSGGWSIPPAAWRSERAPPTSQTERGASNASCDCEKNHSCSADSRLNCSHRGPPRVSFLNSCPQLLRAFLSPLCGAETRALWARTRGPMPPPRNTNRKLNRADSHCPRGPVNDFRY